MEKNVVSFTFKRTTKQNVLKNGENKMSNVYMNRELSWLKFNERVLEEAENPEVPLCERMTFVSIYQSNLDEFFRVRVGSLQDQMLISTEIRENKTKMTSAEQIRAIIKEVKKLNQRKDKAYEKLMKKIEDYGITFINFASAKTEEKKFLEKYFMKEIMPLSSPTIVSKRQPFPFLKNGEIYAVVVLETRNKKERIGIIPCSNNMLARMVELPGGKGRYMLIEELILHYIGKVFKGYKVKGKSLLKVVRNADIDADAAYDEDLDYREFMEDLMKQRKKLSPVRIDLSREMDETVVDALCRYLDVTPDRVFRSEAPLDVSFVFQVQDLLRRNTELFYEKRVPQKSPEFKDGQSILQQITQEDKLLSYPYDSIRPFLKMLTEAAEDDSVISIKMTLYRLAKQSKVIEALCEAAENGKEVVVLVELRARFDEENNIRWSRMLEEAGCQIIYGLEHYKVHSKLCLITRRGENGIQYITQIGTGNYNEKTARLYTDLSLMTANEQIGMDAARVFQALAKGEVVEDMEHLLVAPKCLQSKVIEKIEEQIQKQKNGETAYIGLKMNSLTDKRIIDKLIDASKAGVKIDMIVRGICCLIPGVEGETENIHVISVVGRFLEHSRIYIFGKGEEAQYYIGSADFMTRNTVKRVEVAAPVYSERLKKRLQDLFDLMLSDNKKARKEDTKGTYSVVECKGQPINSQELLYQEAYAKAALGNNQWEAVQQTENKVIE
nr:polyphosphate kinase 1 [uncultured Mediterraneibacter sp.]